MSKNVWDVKPQTNKNKRRGLIQTPLTELVYSSLLIGTVHVCGLIAFLPKREAPSKTEQTYIPASCPTPPNVAVRVSVSSRESRIPTLDRDKF